MIRSDKTLGVIACLMVFKINLFIIDANLKSQIKDLIDCSEVNVDLLHKIKVNKSIVIIEDTDDLFWINKLKEINANDELIIDIIFNLYRSKTGLIFRSKLKYALGPFNRMYLRRELYRADYFLLLHDLTYVVKRALQLFLRVFFKNKSELN